MWVNLITVYCLFLSGVWKIRSSAMSGSRTGAEVRVFQPTQTYFPLCMSTLINICPCCGIMSLCPRPRYLSGRVFVLDLTPGSQAHMDKVVCPGDIIDEINGISLRNSKCGQVSVKFSLPVSTGLIRTTALYLLSKNSHETELRHCSSWTV